MGLQHGKGKTRSWWFGDIHGKETQVCLVMLSYNSGPNKENEVYNSSAIKSGLPLSH